MILSISQGGCCEIWICKVKKSPPKGIELMRCFRAHCTCATYPLHFPLSSKVPILTCGSCALSRSGSDDSKFRCALLLRSRWPLISSIVALKGRLPINNVGPQGCFWDWSMPCLVWWGQTADGLEGRPVKSSPERVVESGSATKQAAFAANHL